MSRGIDIHPYYQRSISSWAAVEKAVKWVYVKTSDGGAAYTKRVGGVVYRPDTHVRNAKGVGLPVGVYHYAQFGDPVAQANVLIAEHRRHGATLPPMLDLEAPFEPNQKARDFAIKFCRRLVAAGFRPVVYMSSSFARALRPDQWGISGLIIWIASYSVNDGRQHALTGGYPGRVDIHQFTSKGRVPGIAGDVDLNESKINLNAPSKPPVKQEDDVKLTDPFNPKEITKRPGSLGHALLNTMQNAAAARALATQTLAVVTKNPDITVAELNRQLDTAIAKHMPSAEELAAALQELDQEEEQA